MKVNNLHLFVEFYQLNIYFRYDYVTILSLPGELDDETLATMSLPRCGVKDKVGSGSDSRSKRYALQGELK